MTNSQERAEQRRRQKLAEVQAQIRSGTLTVRQMTADERARYPARPAAAPRQDRKPRY
jgi:protein subunit release factor B